MTNTEQLREILRRVRDAAAVDDNYGAEDWTHSDKAIDIALQQIEDYDKKTQELYYLKGHQEGYQKALDTVSKDEGRCEAEKDGMVCRYAYSPHKDPHSWMPTPKSSPIKKLVILDGEWRGLDYHIVDKINEIIEFLRSTKQ